MTLQIVVDHLDHMKRPHRTNLELAAVEPPGIAQQVVRFQLQRRQALGDGQQLPADVGQLDAPAPTVEQLDLVLAFQALHLGGQGGLAQPQGAGAGTEASVAGNGQECTQLGAGHP
ncbi:hypothetical protein D3C81_1996080 [compost metagenome]